MPAPLTPAGRSVPVTVSLPPDEYKALTHVINHGEIRFTSAAAAIRHYFQLGFRQANS